MKISLTQSSYSKSKVMDATKGLLGVDSSGLYLNCIPLMTFTAASTASSVEKKKVVSLLMSSPVVGFAWCVCFDLWSLNREPQTDFPCVNTMLQLCFSVQLNDEF